jgi:hypothetical protein
MNKLIIAAMVGALLSLANVTFVRAQEAPSFPAWNDVLKTCSAEYRERTDKTKGREIWQDFLNACKARKGFVAKKDQARGDFVRVPDKSN